jgi:hypothetical protein
MEVTMNDIAVIAKALRSSNNKDSKAYKVIKYYDALIDGGLDDGGVALVRSKILPIEKDLMKWSKEHPNNGSTIMQPEESAIILINDLRNKGLLK